MEDEIQFAKWFSAELKKRNWDVFDAEMEIGISHQSIQNYMKGTTLPSLATFFLILRVFGKRMELVDE